MRTNAVGNILRVDNHVSRRFPNDIGRGITCFGTYIATIQNPTWQICFAIAS